MLSLSVLYTASGSKILEFIPGLASKPELAMTLSPYIALICGAECAMDNDNGEGIIANNCARSAHIINDYTKKNYTLHLWNEDYRMKTITRFAGLLAALGLCTISADL